MARELTPTDLLTAAAGGDVGEVMKLVDMCSPDTSESSEDGAARLNVRDWCGRTAFHLAVIENDSVALQTLVRAGANVNLPDTEKSYTPLHEALETNRTSCVSELINLGADIHCLDSKGRNALMLAAKCGRESCLQLLIKLGADMHHVNCEGRNALFLAVVAGQEGCLQILIKAGGDINSVDSEGRTALIYTAFAGQQRSLKLLIQAGADLNVQVKYDCKNYLGETALMFAAEHQHFDCLKLLLEAGADVNVKTSDGQTALHYAYKSLSLSHNSVNTFECMKILINSGADVTAISRPDMGQTVLMCSARHGRLVNILSMLVEAGAVIDQQDFSGMTALAHAVSTDSHECVRSLVDHGASVNVCDHSGKTPLHYLMSDGDNDAGARQCLEILLSKHPNVNATDKDGMTPLMYVARKSEGQTKTISILLEHGAEINIVDNQGQTALIHSLRLDTGSPQWNLNSIALLHKKANVSAGQVISGRLSKLACLFRDLDLIKLQVGSTVNLEAPWEEFVGVFDSYKRRILQLLIINGVMPLQPNHQHELKCPRRFPTTSSLESAVVRRNSGALKYLIATCYLRAEDLKFSCREHVGDHSVFSVMNNLRSQPWPLVKLCFVAVSTAFGASPGRQERVKNSQLPVKIQRMLLFQEPWSRLCVHQWGKIPLTFSPTKYEELPRPRPLLYHWPVGQALVPCDCGKCDGTMYKYEGSKKDV